MLARVQTWWTILRICIEERLVYRGDFWLGTLMRFLPIVTQIFLWGAVFEGMRATGAAGAPTSTHRPSIDYLLRILTFLCLSRSPATAVRVALGLVQKQLRRGHAWCAATSVPPSTASTFHDAYPGPRAASLLRLPVAAAQCRDHAQPRTRFAHGIDEAADEPLPKDLVVAEGEQLFELIDHQHDLAVFDGTRMLDRSSDPART